jgi:hypothetical protein
MYNFAKEPKNNDLVIEFYNHIKAMQKYNSLLLDNSDDDTMNQLRKVLDDTRYAYNNATTNIDILSHAVDDFIPQKECRLNLKEFHLHECWKIKKLINMHMDDTAKQIKPSEEEESEANYEEMTDYEKQFFQQSWENTKKEKFQLLTNLFNVFKEFVVMLELNPYLLQRLEEHRAKTCGELITHHKKELMEILNKKVPCRQFNNDDATILSMYVDSLLAVQAAKLLAGAPSEQWKNNVGYYQASRVRRLYLVAEHYKEHQQCLEYYRNIDLQYIGTVRQKLRNQKGYKKFLVKHVSSDLAIQYAFQHSQMKCDRLCTCTGILTSPATLAKEALTSDSDDPSIPNFGSNIVASDTCIPSEYENEIPQENTDSKGQHNVSMNSQHASEQPTTAAPPSTPHASDEPTTAATPSTPHASDEPTTAAPTSTPPANEETTTAAPPSPSTPSSSRYNITE